VIPSQSHKPSSNVVTTSCVQSPAVRLTKRCSKMNNCHVGAFSLYGKQYVLRTRQGLQPRRQNPCYRASGTVCTVQPFVSYSLLSSLFGLLDPNRYSVNLGPNPSKLNMEAVSSYWTLESSYKMTQCPDREDHNKNY
jgi:hypothetical protein